jgi:hypothetical protein
MTAGRDVPGPNRLLSTNHTETDPTTTKDYRPARRVQYAATRA